MNERVMQFRIGMFVIVAGLVLGMLIVWFGESPSLFRDHAFVRVRYTEAPGVAEGITVRKSGIRIGEVLSINFDETPNRPEGVIVVLSLERKYKLRKDSIAKISRSLIGDVSIDMVLGNSPDFITYGNTPETAPEIAGDVTPDPSKALAAATAAFEKVGGTLAAIETAADGFSTVAKKAEHIDEFLTSLGDAGRNIAITAKGINRVIAENEGDLRPAVTNLRQVTDRLNAALTPETAAQMKQVTERLNVVAVKLDASLNDIRPLLEDLGATAGKSTPTTSFGQAVLRINRITADLGLLTGALSDGKGHLNENGSIQRLVTHPELFDNLSRMAFSANGVFELARPAVKALGVFAEKIARDPASIGRGVLH